MKQATDMIEASFYKLKMFGVPIEGECRVLGDNEEVMKAGSNPDARLSKKHNSIAFHRIREYVASGMMIIYHEKGESDFSDLITKSLPIERRIDLLKGIKN